LRDLGRKTIDQAEKAFGPFFSMLQAIISSIPNPGADISKQALSFTEQNMKAGSEARRRLVHATTFSKAMQINRSLEKSIHQCRRTYETDHRRVMSAAKDATKGKS